MTKSNRSVLLLGKENDSHCLRALDFLRRCFADVSVCLGRWKQPLPDTARNWSGDYIISYLSRWVVPEYLLQRAQVAAINFHPAPPEYPGIGCNNFALYDNAAEYGCTCHHMEAVVDTGSIIAVERFPVISTDNVESLLLRTYDYQLVLFYKMVSILFADQPLPSSTETWTRAPLTRKEFDELMVIRPSMPEDEIRRRIRATDFGEFQPQIEIAGHVFKHLPQTEDS